jgi:hypothetical protein
MDVWILEQGEANEGLTLYAVYKERDLVFEDPDEEVRRLAKHLEEDPHAQDGSMIGWINRVDYVTLTPHRIRTRRDLRQRR